MSVLPDVPWKRARSAEKQWISHWRNQQFSDSCFPRRFLNISRGVAVFFVGFSAFCWRLASRAEASLSSAHFRGHVAVARRSETRLLSKHHLEAPRASLTFASFLSSGYFFFFPVIGNDHAMSEFRLGLIPEAFSLTGKKTLRHLTPGCVRGARCPSCSFIISMSTGLYHWYICKKHTALRSVCWFSVTLLDFLFKDCLLLHFINDRLSTCIECTQMSLFTSIFLSEVPLTYWQWLL